MSDPVPTPVVTETETLLRSHLFDVVRLEVRYDGEPPVSRDLVRHSGAVAMVALDEERRWLLVRQFRYATGCAMLEIPAGKLEPGESPAATAARELREETGYAASALEPLGGSWMAPGFCDEYMHFFLATGLRYDPLPPDADERLSEPLAFTLEQLEAAIDGGEIRDAKTLVAVTLWRRHSARAGQAQAGGLTLRRARRIVTTRPRG